MDEGELYNLSVFSMCTHNGTHVDAPNHFLAHGKTIDQMDLESFVGPCYVTVHNGEVTKEEVREIVEFASH
mgnify:CR=1 FL=1